MQKFRRYLFRACDGLSKKQRSTASSKEILGINYSVGFEKDVLISGYLFILELEKISVYQVYPNRRGAIFPLQQLSSGLRLSISEEVVQDLDRARL